MSLLLRAIGGGFVPFDPDLALQWNIPGNSETVGSGTAPTICPSPGRYVQKYTYTYSCLLPGTYTPAFCQVLLPSARYLYSCLLPGTYTPAFCCLLPGTPAFCQVLLPSARYLYSLPSARYLYSCLLPGTPAFC